MESSPPIPHSSWRFPGPTTAVPIAAGVIGATLGFPAALLLFERQLKDPSAEVFVTCTTGVLSALVARRGATRDSSGAAFGSIALWCFPAAALNAGLAFQFLAKDGPPFLPLIVASIIGLFWAAPLAVAFGIVYATMAAAALRGTWARSLEMEDKVFGEVGVAVALAGVARALWLADLVSMLPIALGAGVVVVAFGRAALRARWLEHVARGRIDGFAIVPQDEEDDWDLPCIAGDARMALQVVVHEPTAVPSYRTGIDRSRRLARVSS